jgi:hypothetical protein
MDWADDEDVDIFSPDNIKKFLKEWNEENIRLGLTPTDTNDTESKEYVYKKNKKKNKKWDKNGIKKIIF